MKKNNLILIAILALFTTYGFSQTIVGSDHDFSTDGYGSDEICIFCHTPHNADLTVTDSPLWNHEVTTSTFQIYTSGTLDATDVGQPDGASKLCLSCHDGTVAIDSYGGATGNDFITGGALIGTDLRDDHPISFTYDVALVAADGELHDPTVAPISNWLISGKLECASCHDVHNSVAGTNALLVMDNTASALCLTCHAK